MTITNLFLQDSFTILAFLSFLTFLPGGRSELKGYLIKTVVRTEGQCAVYFECGAWPECACQVKKRVPAPCEEVVCFPQT